MKLSPHAEKRWQQRFPGMNPLLHWEQAKRPSKRLMNLIRAANHRPDALRKGLVKPDPRYYLVSPAGVVFVVAKYTHVVVTVLSIKQIKLRAAQIAEMGRFD